MLHRWLGLVCDVIAALFEDINISLYLQRIARDGDGNACYM